MSSMNTMTNVSRKSLKSSWGCCLLWPSAGGTLIACRSSKILMHLVVGQTNHKCESIGICFFIVTLFNAL